MATFVIDQDRAVELPDHGRKGVTLTAFRGQRCNRKRARGDRAHRRRRRCYDERGHQLELCGSWVDIFEHIEDVEASRDASEIFTRQMRAESRRRRRAARDQQEGVAVLGIDAEYRRARASLGSSLMDFRRVLKGVIEHKQRELSHPSTTAARQGVLRDQLIFLHAELCTIDVLRGY